MKDLPGLDDAALDRLLAGKAGDVDGLDDLAAFVEGVQAAYVAPPSPEAALRHVAAAASAAREAAAAPQPVPVPMPLPKPRPGPLPGPLSGPLPGPLHGPLHGPLAKVSWTTRWRRRSVFGASVASMTLFLAAGGLAATAATGGLAAQGDLPAPIQRVVAQAASGVGINLPTADVPAPTPLTAASPGVAKATTPALTPAPTRTPPPTRHASPSAAAVAPSSGALGEGDQQDEPKVAQAAITRINCLLYAWQSASALGLNSDQRSTFFSLLVRDSSAVSANVAPGGKPDPACQAGIDKARVAAQAVSAGGDDRSGRSPTSAPTSAPDDQGGDHGGKQ